MDKLFILAAAILLAGFLSGGIYTVAGTQGSTTIVNRFTGKAWFCAAKTCYPIEYSN